MENHQTTNGDVVDFHQESTARKLKVNRRRSASSVEKQGKSTAAQVTLQCSREILAVYDEVSKNSGLNRQQLFREALETYAALLGRGMRAWKDPTIRE